jgi:CubicO group peptidase (beta-lactamase class C family)
VAKLSSSVPKTETHRAYELSDGYLISSAEDLARFAIAMNNQGAYPGGRLLSPEWMRRLYIPRPQAGFPYAMGWFVDDRAGIPRVHHGGANETFKTIMDLYPSRKLGLVVMINQGYLLDHYISAEQLFGGVEQLARFFDYRFNLVYQASMIFKVLPDIAILMVVGTLPDYALGLIKLWWALSLRRYAAREMAATA